MDGGVLTKKLYLCAFLALVASPVPAARGQVVESIPEVLPEPAELGTSVRFWERIFAEFRPTQCVLHDIRDLRVIYDIRPMPIADRQTQAAIAKGYIREIRVAIKAIVELGIPTTALQNKIWRQMPADLKFTSFLADSGENIRCQRGVDLLGSIKRSLRYITHVKSVLVEQNLPTDLAYLPHLESGYDPMATSKVGARGLWQLMPGTARDGRLLSRTRDLRTDPVASTRYAVTMLARNFQSTQSWPLALTGYNYGINGIMRAMTACASNEYMRVRDCHRAKKFGFAAKNFYPSFLAARNVSQRVEKELARGTGWDDIRIALVNERATSESAAGL